MYVTTRMSFNEVFEAIVTMIETNPTARARLKYALASNAEKVIIVKERVKRDREALRGSEAARVVMTLLNERFADRWFGSSEVFGAVGTNLELERAVLNVGGRNTFSTIAVGVALRELANTGLLVQKAAGGGIMKWRINSQL